VDLAIRPAARDAIGAYVRLTKPRIIVLLLITTVPTMVLAAGRWPSTLLVLSTLIGGTVGAASANTINMVIDRDIDAIMRRTRTRPLPAHAIEPRAALVFGIVLAALSFAFMVATVNLLAAALTQAAIAFYVFVYTMGLKRTTPQNIVIGGAAGAVPVLVGWAAVTGTVGAPAWVLFGIVFMWTPPHFWALALRHAEDYAAAKVPMMPVVAGEEATKRQIVVYAVATVFLTVLLAPVAGLSVVYLALATGLGGWLVGHAFAIWQMGTRAAYPLFRTSILYLAFVFLAVGIDPLLSL